jgi:hypothetical protein
MLLTSAMVFDHHTHLRHDIAPALDRPSPGTDPDRITVVLEWMMAVLGNQLRAAPPDWLDRSIAIELNGPGGGTWLIRPGTPGRAATTGEVAAVVKAETREFPEWATRRAGWTDRNVGIDGDVDYGARFLDSMNVV